MNISFKHRRMICWIYAASILGISILPTGDLVEALELFRHQDKILHVLIYAGLAALLGWARPAPIDRRPAGWMAGMALAAAAYGALMEILQGSLAWVQRACSWGDALANAAGAALGAALFARYAGKPRPSPPADDR